MRDKSGRRVKLTIEERGKLQKQARWVMKYKGLTMKQRAFLIAYSLLGHFMRACDAAHVGKRSVYRRLQEKPEFKEAYAEARERATETLEFEAQRRAVNGVKEPVFHQGQVVGYKNVFSDTLLIFLLKGLKPDTYRERTQMDIKGKLTLEDIVAGSMPTEMLPDGIKSRIGVQPENKN